MSLLAGKVICITGSSRGIGRACAQQSAVHGATALILHYFGDEATSAEAGSLKQEIEQTHSHTKVITVPGDIGDSNTAANIVKSGVEAFGRIGWLFAYS